jgi:predicted membrane channel-forming protein YqfA (hemolysin III family)
MSLAFWIYIVLTVPLATINVLSTLAEPGESRHWPLVLAVSLGWPVVLVLGPPLLVVLWLLGKVRP